MRRRLSWAVLGTSGVLAVVVAAMTNTSEPEEVASPKIVVPMADDAVIDLPPPETTRPSTVFIYVPPVAVTSGVAIPAPPPVTPVQPTVAAPKKAAPTTAPVVPVPPVQVPPVQVPPAVSKVAPPPQSMQPFWGMYSGYWNYYRGGYGGPYNGGPYNGGGYYGGRYYGGGR